MCSRDMGEVTQYNGFKLFSENFNINTFFFEILNKNQGNVITQPAITCSKLTIETLEQGVKYVQS